MDAANPLTDASAADLRRAIRTGRHAGPTAGLARGFVQSNVVILPAVDAEEFAAFCAANPRPCPLIARLEPGNPEPTAVAPGSDLRTDAPRYRVFRRGVAEPDERTEIRALWRKDLVGFLLGCSFTFEEALRAAGLPVRHIDAGRNVPMYRTAVPCAPVGRFAGPLVVTMRPYAPGQIERVVAITARYPRMHGAPVQVGDPAALGIADLAWPDFGDPPTLQQGEVPVFWACGVTALVALIAARPEIGIVHSPGHMFVTDLREDAFREEPPSSGLRSISASSSATDAVRGR